MSRISPHRTSVPGRQATRKRLRTRFNASDLLARIIVAIAILDLNNAMFMMVGLRRAFSYPLLGLCTILLLLNYKRMSAPVIMVNIGLILLYLVFGTLYHDPRWVEAGSKSLAVVFLGTLLMTTSVGCYVASLTRADGLHQFLRFVRNVFVIGALTIYLSPLIVEVAVNPPLTAESRASGFFGNAINAAIVSSLGFAFALAAPSRNTFLDLALGLFFIGATVITFSKTGFLILLVVGFVWSLKRTSRLAGILYPLVFVLAIGLVTFAEPLLTGLAQSPELDFTLEQRSRIEEFGSLLSGRVDSEVTTGRSDLWGLGLDRAKEHFPHGMGLGAYHTLIGGHMARGTFYEAEASWLGVHQFFLMVWGEAGFLVFLGFVGFYIWLFYQAVFQKNLPELVPYSVLILIVVLLSTHNGYEVRLINMVQGILFGLLVAHARQRTGRSQRHKPGRVNRDRARTGRQRSSR